MVYLVERGGNHGWSVNEGSHPFRPERKKGPGTFATPLVEHPHSDFRSITGGYVYESDRLPKLKGAYIYGDYDTGKVWSLRVDGGKVIDHHQLADTQIRIVEFAQDEAGEVYLVDFAGGGFHRLDRSTSSGRRRSRSRASSARRASSTRPGTSGPPRGSSPIR